jgi:DNA-binding MarR family transcriptional regulator
LDPSVQRVESALTQLVRRIHRVELHSPTRSHRLERSAYLVLVRLYDHGPQRLSELAAAFELDLSTVSRQVRSLDASGLIVREADTSDRRASILRLTEDGRQAMYRTRALRRGRLRNVLANWPSEDVATFAELLERFGADCKTADVQSLSRSIEAEYSETRD